AYNNILIENLRRNFRWIVSVLPLSLLLPITGRMLCPETDPGSGVNSTPNQRQSVKKLVRASVAVP
ncbi:MAG: hypothetical protein ABI651_16755, partial [Verrucomicrobiota bacterium]